MKSTKSTECVPRGTLTRLRDVSDIRRTARSCGVQKNGVGRDEVGFMKLERIWALVVIVAVFSLGWHFGWFHRIVLISK
jgi:hypothetical protein